MLHTPVKVINVDILGKYVFPEISVTLKNHQKTLLEEIKKCEEPVAISCDGQCDSPGHNATYCTVTSMDVKTNKVISKLSTLKLSLIHI